MIARIRTRAYDEAVKGRPLTVEERAHAESESPLADEP